MGSLLSVIEDAPPHFPRQAVTGDHAPLRGDNEWQLLGEQTEPPPQRVDVRITEVTGITFPLCG